jgi:hypothetical protein
MVVFDNFVRPLTNDGKCELEIRFYFWGNVERSEDGGLLIDWVCELL